MYRDALFGKNKKSSDCVAEMVGSKRKSVTKLKQFFQNKQASTRNRPRINLGSRARTHLLPNGRTHLLILNTFLTILLKFLAPPHIHLSQLQPVLDSFQFHLIHWG